MERNGPGPFREFCTLTASQRGLLPPVGTSIRGTADVRHADYTSGEHSTRLFPSRRHNQLGAFPNNFALVRTCSLLGRDQQPALEFDCVTATLPGPLLEVWANKRFYSRVLRGLMVRRLPLPARSW
jgi:hypothetical protein